MLFKFDIAFAGHSGARRIVEMVLGCICPNLTGIKSSCSHRLRLKKQSWIGRFAGRSLSQENVEEVPKHSMGLPYLPGSMGQNIYGNYTWNVWARRKQHPTLQVPSGWNGHFWLPTCRSSGRRRVHQQGRTGATSSHL